MSDRTYDIDEFSPRTGDLLRSDSSVQNMADLAETATNPFGDVRTARLRQLVELKSVPEVVSVKRNTTVEEGSGTVSNSSGEFKLSTTANGADRAVLSSGERGRYLPGYAAEVGLGVRAPDTPTTDAVMRWGYYDENDGYQFGRDANGLFVRVIRGGNEVAKVYQSDWNGDTLDGNGPSGINLDPAVGHVYRIDHTWYGYGPAAFKVITFDSDGRQRNVTAHRFKPTGNAVTVNEPNLPIRAEVDNNGTASALDMFVGGRQYSVTGVYEPSARITPARAVGASLSGTTFVPVVSARRKLPKFAGVSCKPASLAIISADDLLWELRLDADLGTAAGGSTDPSWGDASNIGTDEAALEVDTSADAISGGEVVDAGFHSGGQGSNAALTRDRPTTFDYIEDQPLTLAVRLISGTGGSGSFMYRNTEEW